MTAASDYDSPWKEILEAYFQDFMEFFFPGAAEEIDWSCPVAFLDKELQQIVQDAELGRRYADKLVKVYLRGGEEQWLLIHIEVQGQHDRQFAERMFVYAYRLYDRYRRALVSLAILADDSTKWRPREFVIERWGSRIGLSFPSVKLLDYRDAATQLDVDPNPFAVVVQAHLAALETRGDDALRYVRKLALTRRLYERGLDRQRIIDLYRFIDWLMRLPEALEIQYTDAIYRIEEELRMPYPSFVERRGETLGIVKGEALGIVKGEAQLLRRQLQRRFGPLDDERIARLDTADSATLERWGDRLLDAKSLDEVFREE